MKRTIPLWLASLVATAAATATFAYAQSQPADPRIISGVDIGFRIDGRDPRTGNPTGTLMIRMAGEWVEVAPSAGLRLLK